METNPALWGLPIPFEQENLMAMTNTPYISVGEHNRGSFVIHFKVQQELAVAVVHATT